MADPKEKARLDRSIDGATPAPEAKIAAPVLEATAPLSRRGALGGLVVLGSVAYAGALAAPALTFVVPAGDEQTGKERWIRVAKVADVTPEPRRFQVLGEERDAFTVTKGQILGSIWVLREGEAVRAFSATCPHLGCSIDLNADKKSFGCPCHASRFALQGQPEAGPSPRALDPLATRARDGYLEVDFRRFRTGIAARTELGA